MNEEDKLQTPDYTEVSHLLSFGYYRPQFPKGSYEIGWNLISQKGAIHKALKDAYEEGYKACQQKQS